MTTFVAFVVFEIECIEMQMRSFDENAKFFFDISIELLKIERDLSGRQGNKETTEIEK